MSARYVAVWFCYPQTDWYTRRNAERANRPVVIQCVERNRRIIREVNYKGETAGLQKGMTITDARALVPELEIIEEENGLLEKIIQALGFACIRFTPVVAMDKPDGLSFDASGCAHLWGGEQPYLQAIEKCLQRWGYAARAAMADTIGAAWAAARYADQKWIAPGEQLKAMESLPPQALRLEETVIAKLLQLGLQPIGRFMGMPRRALRRRFGPTLLERLDQALGFAIGHLEPLVPPVPYAERLPCLDPIVSAAGIEMAIEQLLEKLCQRLGKEGKGVREAVLKCFRVDGHVQQIQINTTRPSVQPVHLQKLLALKINTLQPDLGFELFILEATRVDDAEPEQQRIWDGGSSDKTVLAELLDRIEGKLGKGLIQRYQPAAHYWPERAYMRIEPFAENKNNEWPVPLQRPRPVCLFPRPVSIEVTAPVPDYPPMLFRYKGKLHKVKRADGPERIGQEWWLQSGDHRDYYTVEDEEGVRFWIFRDGHYDVKRQRHWYLHGIFA